MYHLLLNIFDFEKFKRKNIHQIMDRIKNIKLFFSRIDKKEKVNKPTDNNISLKQTFL